jgi:CRISPR-associated protein Csm3
MKLNHIESIQGKIILQSGLHVGAGDMELHIGGVDKQVVKHPHTLQPYIPGSSLKGKIRSLLEMRTGLMAKSNGAPLSFKHLKQISDSEKNNGACKKILKIFGCSGGDLDNDYDLGPTRVSFSDCPLDQAWLEEANRNNFVLTEVKAENSINRINGTAQNPRFTERVPAGAVFEFNVSLKKFEGDEGLLDFLLEGFKLLELDALGGSGSRGYGRVRFEFDDAHIKEKYDAIQLNE